MSRIKSSETIPSAVYLLAFSLFAMGSAEFLMGGILPMIAQDLNISLPTAGTLISAFAVGALIGGPPFAILAVRWPARRSLFISQMAFVVATLVSLLAQGYGAILLGRFFMGLAYACFWAVAAATAVQLSPPDRRAKSLSIVVSGLTVAMVLGGPAGTYISEATGWRGGFWAVVVVTLISALSVLLALPKHSASDAQAPDLATELRAMKRPCLWVAYATTMFTTAAYMGTFGYIAALLTQVSGLASEHLPAVLVLFGVGAFIGLTIGGRSADRKPFATLVAGIMGLIISSVLIAWFATSLWVTVAMVFMLGLAGFLLNPPVWGRVYALAPDAPMLAGATNASAFQAGLTLAPLLAGIPISLGYNLASVAWVGVIIALISLGLAMLDVRLSPQAANA